MIKVLMSKKINRKSELVSISDEDELINFPLPKAILDEWEKVKQDPAFVGLFYFSDNHIKFKYLIMY